MDSGNRPYSVPKGEGAVLVTAADGVGSDSEFCRNSKQQGTAVCLGGLAVDGHTRCAFLFPRQSSLQPQRGQQRPGEIRDSPSPGRTITLVTVPHVHITRLLPQPFPEHLPCEGRNWGQSEPPLPTPLIPTQQRQARDQQPDSGLAVCSSGLQAAWMLCWHGTWAIHGLTAAPGPCSVLWGYKVKQISLSNQG